MPKWICKINTKEKQFRVTIPKLLIDAKMWWGTRCVLIEEGAGDSFIIRRFIDGESLKSEVEADRSKTD